MNWYIMRAFRRGGIRRRRKTTDVETNVIAAVTLIHLHRLRCSLRVVTAAGLCLTERPFPSASTPPHVAHPGYFSAPL